MSYKFKVRVNYFRLAVLAVISLARFIVTKLTGNTTFPNPPFPLGDISNKADEVETKEQAAKTGDHEAVRAMNQSKSELALMLYTVASYVNTTVTNGDEVKLGSSGFPLTKRPSAKPLPEQVTDIKFGLADPGEVFMMFGKSKNAGQYLIMMSDNPDTNFKIATVATKRKVTITGLVSGQRYWFVIIPVNATGAGLQSEPVNFIAQ